MRARNGSVELEYTAEGPRDGRRLLLVNGLGSPLVAYQPGFVAALTDRGFRTARFDNRDVGRSTRFQGIGLAYTINDMVSDALAVLDALGWDQAHIFGQSMGGMIVQQLAISAPDRVASMTSLMSGTGERGFGRAGPEAVKALVEPAPADRAGWLEHRVRTERIWASPALWDETWVRAKGEAMFDYGVDPKGAARQYRAVAAAPSRDAELARLQVPALVIHGSADTLVGPDAGRHTAEVIPGARYVEIEGMGHDLPPGWWDRIATELATFTAGDRPTRPRRPPGP
jgi:pimeloyl-ACP methyl ester carboxylesterase